MQMQMEQSWMQIQQNVGFLGMLLGILGLRLLRNMLACRGVTKGGEGDSINKEEVLPKRSSVLWCLFKKHFA